MYGYAYPIRTISASGVYSAQAKLREKLRIKALIEPTMVPVYISPPFGNFRGISHFSKVDVTALAAVDKERTLRIAKASAVTA